MAAGHYSFDPYDPAQREAAKSLIAAIEAQLGADELRPQPEIEAATPEKNDSQIASLLETEAGKRIYGAAAEHFLAGEEFTLDQLAAKAGHKSSDVLAWWRRLGGRHERVGGILFHRHDGRPVKFSLDDTTRKAIRQHLNLSDKRPSSRG